MTKASGRQRRLTPPKFEDAGQDQCEAERNPESETNGDIGLPSGVGEAVFAAIPGKCAPENEACGKEDGDT